MESVTKNKKSFEDLQNLVSTSMSVPLVSAQELTEGYFNAAYLLELADGRKCVMKIAPLSDENLMSYEKGMMGAEIDAMHLAGTCKKIPVAQVYAADTSRERCDSPYFIMECLPGESFAQRKKIPVLRHRTENLHCARRDYQKPAHNYIRAFRNACRVVHFRQLV